MLSQSKALGQRTTRRLRYLTFCAEGAIDVIALRNAKIIKRSRSKLYDTVVFFDFSPQAIDKTLSAIEGANGFPADFFKLMNLGIDEAPTGDLIDGMPRDRVESDATFAREKYTHLFGAFRDEFPFDLINLDVERYVIIPSEELPGNLLAAWDRILDWQKRSRMWEGKPCGVDQFTLFFTTKIGPKDLPSAHRDGLINLLDENVTRFPPLMELLKSQYSVETAANFYESDFDNFLKLAVPKALVSRALSKDWSVDLDLTYRAFVFDRTPPNSESYTMVHYVLHFRRCSPSLGTLINPHAIPASVNASYAESITRIFATAFEDVDQLKAEIEDELRGELSKLGVPADAFS
jgi:hypothetical protein